MENINKKYNLEIEILTPLSIGAGAEKDWVRGIDFVVENSKLYKLNLKKMIKAGIKPDELSLYFSSKNEAGLLRKLAGHIETVSDAIIPLPIQSDNDVKSFVKNQLNGKPVLMGSSLKGSIRSVLFQYLGGNSKDGREVFGSSTEGDEFMRFIKISDAEFEDTSLVNTKIFNLRKSNNEWRGGWKFDSNTTQSNFSATGFNTLYESLLPHKKGYATLILSKNIYDLFEKEVKRHIKSELKRPIIQDGVIKLFEIINRHTRNYLIKERSFFNEYSTDKTDEIIASIDNLLEQIPSDNSYCILKMSAGSGFHSITGDWQFNDYTEAPLDRKRVREGKVNPKSRKIAVWDNHFSLMGFVKMRSVSNDEIEQAEEARRAEIQRKKEEQRTQAEQEVKLQKEKEVRRKQFEVAISEVQQLIKEKNFESAFEKYNSTCEMFPEGRQNSIDIEELKFQVEKIIIERKQQKFAEKQKQERIQAQQTKVESGLAKLLSEKYEFGPNEGKFKVVTFKVCIQKVNSWMKAAETDDLPEEQHTALHETVKRLSLNPDKKEMKSWANFKSSIWQQISSLVGPDIATQWFNEIMKL